MPAHLGSGTWGQRDKVIVSCDGDSFHGGTTVVHHGRSLDASFMVTCLKHSMIGQAMS